MTATILRAVYLTAFRTDRTHHCVTVWVPSNDNGERAA